MTALDSSPMMAADALGDVDDVMLTGPWWTALYTYRWLLEMGEIPGSARGDS